MREILYFSWYQNLDAVIYLFLKHIKYWDEICFFFSFLQQTKHQYGIGYLVGYMPKENISY